MKGLGANCLLILSSPTQPGHLRQVLGTGARWTLPQGPTLWVERQLLNTADMRSHLHLLRAGKRL